MMNNKKSPKYVILGIFLSKLSSNQSTAVRWEPMNRKVQGGHNTVFLGFLIHQKMQAYTTKQ